MLIMELDQVFRMKATSVSSCYSLSPSLMKPRAGKTIKAAYSICVTGGSTKPAKLPVSEITVATISSR
jgi:hypothetical protein